MSEVKKKKGDKYSPLAPEDPMFGNVFIDQVLQRFGIDPTDPSNQLLMRWHDIVGSEISKHTFFEKIEENTLHIACDNPSRASYIKLNGKDILKNIKGVFPELEINKISVRVIPSRRNVK